ncbi:DUF3795 domain-containing protein [Chloroflexota bacterium]
MSAIMAFCGVRCDECDTYIATKSDDNTKKQEIANRWSRQFNTEFKPEQMNCVGCKSESGPLFFYCNMCQLKQCDQQKGVLTCAHCGDYGCENLEQFFKISPENKHILDELRKSP